MKDKKLYGFTFVELLLVMLILGIIISLTLPIINKIKDDDDIYRAYMKKANQDVTDAVNMISIKENKFRGFKMIKDAYQNNCTTTNNNSSKKALSDAGYIDAAANDCTNTLRNLFNAGLGAFECGTCKIANDPTCYKGKDALPCIASDFKYNSTEEHIVTTDAKNNVTASKPGLVIGGKPVLIFKYDYDDSGVNANDPIYGYVYVDMNKDKGPNEYCKDRYKFIIYNDRVAMETDPNRGGCSMVLGG